MRIKHYYLLVSLFALCALSGMLSSCSYKDGGKLYYYNLALEIIDQNGKNMLADIDCAPNEIVTFPMNYKLMLRHSNTQHIGRESTAFVTNDGQENFLIINFDTIVLFGFSTPLYADFTCFNLFGDNLPHEIETKWKKKKMPNTECTKFIIDGKEFPITYNEKLQYYTVTIVPA